MIRCQQAPKPAHEPGAVSPPPSPQSTSPPSPHKIANQEIARKHRWRLNRTYHHKPAIVTSLMLNIIVSMCIKEKGRNAPQCDKFARHYRSPCPGEWVNETKPERLEPSLPYDDETRLRD
ncbi:hypothetical protein QQP08_010801 [Theobroma cacao]|nr:hypothetical protein QQP08_010801 [Theobroma cacao]